MTLDDFAKLEGIYNPKLLPDGRVAFLMPMMFTCGLCVGALDDAQSYEDRWCYPTPASAVLALHLWNGVDEPAGWIRHPFTGRRRPNGDPAQEYVNP